MAFVGSHRPLNHRCQDAVCSQRHTSVALLKALTHKDASHLERVTVAKNHQRQRSKNEEKWGGHGTNSAQVQVYSKYYGNLQLNSNTKYGSKLSEKPRMPRGCRWRRLLLFPPLNQIASFLAVTGGQVVTCDAKQPGPCVLVCGCGLLPRCKVNEPAACSLDRWAHSRTHHANLSLSTHTPQAKHCVYEGSCRCLSVVECV